MTKSEIESLIQSNYEPYILPESHPAFKSAQDENWKYEKVKLDLIKSEYGSNKKEDIISWFWQEVNLYDLEFGTEASENRWLNLERYYLINPEELPLILLKGNDGYYYLNDGHHRHAIALKNNWIEVWGIVAYPDNYQS